MGSGTDISASQEKWSGRSNGQDRLAEGAVDLALPWEREQRKGSGTVTSACVQLGTTITSGDQIIGADRQDYDRGCKRRR
jgi:hypothetical protein